MQCKLPVVGSVEHANRNCSSEETKRLQVLRKDIQSIVSILLSASRMGRKRLSDWNVSSDVVLRHYRSCASRGPRPVPSPSKRGKKRKACDHCARSKLFCDFELPCETCLVSSKPCTYGRVANDSLGPNAQWSEQNSSENHPQRVSISPSSVISPGIKSDIPFLMEQLNNKVAIPFLLNYTNPQTKTLPDMFGRLSSRHPDLEGQSGIEDLLQWDLLQWDLFFPSYGLFPLAPSFAIRTYDL
jgi:hypothetical protein